MLVSLCEFVCKRQRSWEELESRLFAHKDFALERHDAVSVISIDASEIESHSLRILVILRFFPVIFSFWGTHLPVSLREQEPFRKFYV